ncbi:hypothetical protein EDB89DRAFT_2073753 [Lactarius sanguifluus]|nr:hypothetical protein EDB89DRAFT_2073753 [Lactarius sanguifluus]
MKANICTTSKELQNDTCNRSSVEVEQILPSTEHVPDPQDFYASDSPVLDDNFDLDQDFYESAEEFLERVNLEVQDDHPVRSSFTGSHICFSHLAYMIRVDWFEAFPAATDPSAPAFARMAVQPTPTNRMAFPTNNFCSVTLMSCYSGPAPGLPTMRTSCDSNGFFQLKLVQVELNCLLQEDPYGRTPKPSRVSTFMDEWECTGHSAKACDATPIDFMVDVVGLPRSPWNIAAGWVFMDHFIQKMGYDDTPEMQQEIAKAFTNHIRSLSRQQHKYQLFQHHHEITKLFDLLTKHLGVLDTLGPDGMSSDESLVDPDMQKLTYTVAKPNW